MVGLEGRFKRRHTSCASRAKTLENKLLRVVYSERVIALQFEMSVEVSETLFQIFCCSSFPESQPWYLDFDGKDAMHKKIGWHRISFQIVTDRKNRRVYWPPTLFWLRSMNFWGCQALSKHVLAILTKKILFLLHIFSRSKVAWGPRNIWLTIHDRWVIRSIRKKSLSLPRWNLPYPAIWKG